MATTSDYLTQLQVDKQALVDNLVAKGVSATNDETFTSLVPKVNDIQTGGGDLSEYFSETISAGTSSTSGIATAILKMPKFTNSGTSCAYMFSGCTAITSLDLSNFDTTNVTDLSGMFYLCGNLTSLDLSNFNTSKVTSMGSMFLSCSSITSLDLSNFDTSKVTSMGSMFYGCNKLTRLDIRSFDFTNVKSYVVMFNFVPTNCLIIVKDETAKEWITSKFPTLTNVKTVAELE